MQIETTFLPEIYSVEDIEEEFFKHIWIDIPTPFKKGDIVVSSDYNWGGTNEPFVLLEIEPWRVREETKKRGYYREPTDSSDMVALGWSTGFYLQDDCINDDVMACYLDLEYYRGSYRGGERLLPLMAKSLIGEIDYWETIHLYRLITSENEAERMKKVLDHLNKQGTLSSILDGDCTVSE